MTKQCLGCGAVLTRTLIDLGAQPLANAYVPPDRADAPDKTYPLHVRVCDACLLAQLDEVVPPEAMFGHYAYFSSFSESWLAHARDFVAMAIARFGLNASSKVVEIASNDGYLLQYVRAAGIACLGVEPAENVARVARARGVPTEIAFFGAATAARLRASGHEADLLICNNVLAHVPGIDDFVAGLGRLLQPGGVLSVEFPHLVRLLAGAQFDTIYHEHVFYFSVLAIEAIFARHGLRVFDAAELPTHGGSLRLFACHEASRHARTESVGQVRAAEIAAGLDRPEGYDGLAEKAGRVRDDFVAFLDTQRANGRKVAAYGAAAKGNTLLNYCGIGAERIAFVADRNPAKQNMLLPGSRIAVVSPAAIDAARPDFIVILPWNLRAEIIGQLSRARAWGARFVTAVPCLRVED